MCIRDRDIIEHAVVGGHAKGWAWVLKIVFTAITIGAGFKGGEIVPTFFIGATFGCVVGHLFGLNPGFAAAIGMIAMFCGDVYKRQGSYMPVFLAGEGYAKVVANTLGVPLYEFSHQDGHIMAGRCV